jgi:hypothetical protein
MAWLRLQKSGFSSRVPPYLHFAGYRHCHAMGRERRHQLILTFLVANRLRRGLISGMLLFGRENERRFINFAVPIETFIISRDIFVIMAYLYNHPVSRCKLDVIALKEVAVR